MGPKDPKKEEERDEYGTDDKGQAGTVPSGWWDPDNDDKDKSWRDNNGHDHKIDKGSW
jgi:hypothetical protein